MNAHATQFDPVLLGQLGDGDCTDDLLAVDVLGHQEGVVTVGRVVGELGVGHSIAHRATVRVVKNQIETDE